MKKSTGLILIILLLVVAYFLNPRFEKHLAKTGIGDMERKLSDGELDKNSVTSKIYIYNNYLIFSTTTNRLTGERATFGMFGVVFR
jgi:hypothetical protein